MNGQMVFAAMATILVVANIIGSYAVGRSDFYDSRQKTVQIVLVWLLPIFGLLLVGGVLWSDYERASRRGDQPEHVIPDYAWPGGGREEFHHDGQ